MVESSDGLEQHISALEYANKKTYNNKINLLIRKAEARENSLCSFKLLKHFCDIVDGDKAPNLELLQYVARAFKKSMLNENVSFEQASGLVQAKKGANYIVRNWAIFNEYQLLIAKGKTKAEALVILSNRLSSVDGDLYFDVERLKKIILKYADLEKSLDSLKSDYRKIL